MGFEVSTTRHMARSVVGRILGRAQLHDGDFFLASTPPQTSLRTTTTTTTNERMSSRHWRQHSDHGASSASSSASASAAAAAAAADTTSVMSISNALYTRWRVPARSKHDTVAGTEARSESFLAEYSNTRMPKWPSVVTNFFHNVSGAVRHGTARHGAVRRRIR